MKIEKLLKTLYQSDQVGTHSSCPDATELAAYCDNTLPEKQKSLFEQHLLSCQLSSDGGVVFDYAEYDTYSLEINSRNEKKETLNILLEGE